MSENEVHYTGLSFSLMNSKKSIIRPAQFLYVDSTQQASAFTLIWKENTVGWQCSWSQAFIGRVSSASLEELLEASFTNWHLNCGQMLLNIQQTWPKMMSVNRHRTVGRVSAFQVWLWYSLAWRVGLRFGCGFVGPEVGADLENRTHPKSMR